MNRIVATVFLCLATCTAFAQRPNPPATESAELLIWEPPNVPLITTVANPTVAKQMITSIRVSDLHVVLEETRLDTLQARFGGQIGTKGDAGDSVLWLCLHGSDASGLWVLWLMSGEIDGPNVGGFQWRRVPVATQFDRRCQMLADADNNVVLPLGIRLGTSEAKILQILGRPTIRTRDTLRYEHEHNLMLHHQPYTSSNSVIIMLRHGVVWAIDVDKTTQD